MQSQESQRLAAQGDGNVPLWYKWGPYVAERSWGTVREDYSFNGDAWNYFPFDQAHQRVYRWGEDGIAGWCDRYQTLVFAPAFWNGKDPILKERLFGLSSPQGNHGEDVKEYYFHLDATPTHSYMKFLYKYPQAEFPYNILKIANAARGTDQPEYELIDTGVLVNNRYFDIFIEYAKLGPEDMFIKIEAFNRGDQTAPLHIIPQLWFRNRWSWGDMPLPEPRITNHSFQQNHFCLLADDSEMFPPSNLPFNYLLGPRFLYATNGGKPLFTDNENYNEKRRFFKDGINKAIIQGDATVNPEECGTKAGLHYYFESVPPQESVTIYLRLTNHPCENPLNEAEQIIQQRKQEADEFYRNIHPPKATLEECMIQRQALAGMIWTKQIYLFDVDVWLKGDNVKNPPPDERKKIRNLHWRHLNSMRILSMPDKWEYPWFAAWDLAFHCITFALVDLEFAKEQLWLLLFDQFQHPNGAIPAYEWEFSDLNPPVQAWAALRLYKMGYEQTGVRDFGFLKKCFLKLLMNFSFWVNKVDSSGCNVFEGGFLGLDNITIIDRSVKTDDNTTLKQSDGTGWMGMLCLNLMRIALELSKEDPTYQTLATKFFQHFIYIAYAMKQSGPYGYNLWSQTDGFFYDLLIYPDGRFSRFRLRSLVGLIPLYAIEIIEEEELEQFPEFRKNFQWFLKNRQEISQNCTATIDDQHKKLFILALPDKEQLQRVVRYLSDPNEFMSPFGIRSLSKFHEQNPFFYKGAQVSYEPGESLNRMKGGNSNWRGPIWFPTNYLLIESLKIYSIVFKNHAIKLDRNNFIVLNTLIEETANRMIALFKLDSQGHRPYFGSFGLAKDPHFQHYLWFNEYFNAETGQGLGASHQTGWTGLVANLIDEFRR